MNKKLAALLALASAAPLLAGLPKHPDWSADGVVDAHAHVGTFRGYDLSESTLLAGTTAYGVRLALISDIDGAELPGTTANLSERDANRAAEEAVRRNPGRLRALFWARPSDGSPANAEEFLSHRLPDGSPVFVGLKLHPEMNRFAADSPQADAYLAVCEKLGLPAAFHCGTDGSLSSPERIYAAARKRPAVPVVLYHMGFGTDHSSAIAAVEKSIERGDARLYLETAQAGPDAVIAAARRVGAGRVLFGSDATYFGKTHYSHYAALVARIKADLPPADAAKVLHGNAEELFRLPPAR